MATTELIQSIEGGNLHRCVSESIYNDSIALSQQKLVVDNGVGSTRDIEFVPERHLRYYAEGPEAQSKYDSTRRLSMEQLGLTHPNQISDIGVSDPFALFTEEAVQIIRHEVLDRDLFMKYARFNHASTSGCDCTLRGYVKNGDQVDAPFTYQAWTHPKTTELISRMAGVELEIVMDFEIAHVNIGMKDPREANHEIIRDSRLKALTGASSGEDIPAIVGWHYDSYPYVCVLMLSDTSNMIGGETSLRMGGASAGKMAVVPGPQSGSAAVLQGRLIEHLAPLPLGMAERITMVTSYRAKDPLKKDESVLSTVKPEINYGSRYNDFYPQWVSYRCNIIQQRLQYLIDHCPVGKPFNKSFCTDFLKETEEYLKKTYTEMQVTESEWQEAAKNTKFTVNDTTLI